MIWPIILLTLFFIGFVWHTNDRLDKLEEKSQWHPDQKLRQNRK